LVVGIVGGGAAGLTIASLAKSVDIHLFEEHKEVGKPPHCTGLVGLYTAKFYSSLLGPKIVLNTYKKIFFHTPKKTFRLISQKPIAYKLDRILLEEKLFDRAQALGHKVYLGEKARKIDSDSIITSKRCIRVDKIVIAEGAKRFFAKQLTNKTIDHIMGTQWLVEAKDMDRNAFHTIFLRTNPYFFAWLVPINDEQALMGIGYRKYLVKKEKLARIIEKKTGVKVIRIGRAFGGLIPVGIPVKPVVDNKYLIGDALPASKPFTGGGLYSIAYLAPYLAKELEGNVGIYDKIVKKLRRKLKIQYLAYLGSSRTVGTWIIPYVLGLFIEAGLEIEPRDYDEHDRILFKAIKYPFKNLFHR